MDILAHVAQNSNLLKYRAYYILGLRCEVLLKIIKFYEDKISLLYFLC